MNNATPKTTKREMSRPDEDRMTPAQAYFVTGIFVLVGWALAEAVIDPNGAHKGGTPLDFMALAVCGGFLVASLVSWLRSGPWR